MSSRTEAADRVTTGWNPAARMAVVLVLGVLAGADIWIFTMAKITSLPVLQVQLGPMKVGLSLLRLLVA